MWENAIHGVTDAAILVLNEELREIKVKIFLYRPPRA
jgi:hypothetical protein